MQTEKQSVFVRWVVRSAWRAVHSRGANGKDDNDILYANTCRGSCVFVFFGGPFPGVRFGQLSRNCIAINGGAIHVFGPILKTEGPSGRGAEGPMAEGARCRGADSRGAEGSKGRWAKGRGAEGSELEN